MQADSQILVVFCTFPDEETAARIATQLVTQKLAACANILPGVRSIYRWESKIEDSPEVLAVLKVPESTYPRMEETLTELHPYEVPEILGIPVAKGLPPYLQWVHDSVS